MGDAGVIDEDVEAGMRRRDVAKEGVDRGGIRDVAGVAGGPSARLGDLGGHARGARGIEVSHRHGGAALGEDPRDRRANPRSGPGNERGFSLKIEHSAARNIPCFTR